MVQELVDLRTSITEGRYEDALEIVDELEGMGKKAILRNINSFLVILLTHLIKNQIEQRLTNSWAASITNSILEIQDLNLKENKKSFYVKQEDWQDFLEIAIAKAIITASLEVREGKYNPIQLEGLMNKEDSFEVAKRLLSLTYDYATPELPKAVYSQLAELPGGKDWLG